MWAACVKRVMADVQQPSFYLSCKAELLRYTSRYMGGPGMSDHSPPSLNLPLPIVIAPLLLSSSSNNKLVPETIEVFFTSPDLATLFFCRHTAFHSQSFCPHLLLTKEGGLATCSEFQNVLACNLPFPS